MSRGTQKRFGALVGLSAGLITLVLMTAGAAPVDRGPSKEPGPSPASGIVKIGSPAVIEGPGILSIEALGRTLVKARPGLEQCYAEVLRRNRSTRGQVTAQLHIQSDGLLIGLSLFHNTAGDDTGRCVVEQLRTLRFPAPQGGHIVVVCPISFQPR